MNHIPDLIFDLALILGAAAFITLVFKKLKQPLVLGYIIAGFLVGPYFKWLPTVRETENIQIWAEIGVIFLLFSLGLEFSFKKLLKVGGSASITAVIEVVVMVMIGYGIGRLLGWSYMDSLFLGGILSISSTTIIIRAFDELGLKSRQFASLVFGVLIVEDLVAIVLLVLLSTLAVSRQFEGAEMLFSILKLAFFLAVWFLSGIFFIPTLLRRFRKLMTDEMLLVISIALCLLMVIFADKVGFSPALGAFIMGSILAETTRAEKIEHLVRPVKDLFGAIFFVSVGMLIDPKILVAYAGPIAILSIATIAGKILSSAFGALLSGQPLQTSIQTGFSLAQIGEFSFIIATLGLTLKVTSDFLYPIAVAVSAVTTLTTPYLIKSSGNFYQWINSILPAKVRNRITRYSTETRKISVSSQWKLYLRSTFLNMVILLFIVFTLVYVFSLYILPIIQSNGDSLWLKITASAILLLILLPFLWALAIRNPSVIYKSISADERYKGVFRVLSIFRLMLAAVFIAFLFNQFFPFYTGVAATIIVISLLLFWSKNIQFLYNRIEQRFVINLNQREIAEATSNRTELAPWDARIIPIDIGSNASCIGQMLLERRWREQVGINVVLIKRGDRQIPAPDKHERIFPGDQLLVLGTDLQIRKLNALIRPDKKYREEEESGIGEVVLQQFKIGGNSTLAGVSITQSDIRTKYRGLVVGVERNGERILNPESAFVFQKEDIVFVVGEKNRLSGLFS